MPAAASPTCRRRYQTTTLSAASVAPISTTPTPSQRSSDPEELKQEEGGDPHAAEEKRGHQTGELGDDDDSERPTVADIHLAVERVGRDRRPARVPHRQHLLAEGTGAVRQEGAPA